MSDTPIKTEAEVIAELSPNRQLPAWLEGQTTLPFHMLTPLDFERFCYLLLKREFPQDRIALYGSSGDAGRDIVHRRAEGAWLIQCKRYSNTVAPGVVREELAKLCVNMHDRKLRERFDRVAFYVVPRLSNDAIDLIDDRSKWLREAEEALQSHLKRPPTADQLAFARDWWPDIQTEEAVSLTDRASRFGDLIARFFAVRTVEVSSGATTSTNALPASTSLPPVADLVVLFGVVSRRLAAHPTTLADGRWLDRPELVALLVAARSDDTPLACLLGPPGGGKSALLARVVTDLTADDTAVLAVKADHLPAHVDSLAKLTEWLRLPNSVVDCVAAVAAHRLTVVILDQLDALADLTDRHAGRLRVLLDLIDALRGRPNVRVICSCREFEFRTHDAFRTIHVRSINLQPLPWPDIAAVLTTHGIAADLWPQEARSAVCLPQHLSVFLRLAGGGPPAAAASYQAMLDHWWARAFAAPERSGLLIELAEEMDRCEQYFVPAARYESRRPIVDALIAAGALERSERPHAVQFTHQTLFEHARARAFVARDGGLATHALTRRDSLFVRPALWAALHYLRENDPAAYQREAEALWAADLPRHLRLLMVDALGNAGSGPADWERARMTACLDDPALRRRTLLSLSRNPIWFAELRGGTFPAIMRLPAEERWPMRSVLIGAWSFAVDDCLSLMETCWLPDPEFDSSIIEVLYLATPWTPRAVALARRVIRRQDINAGAASYFVHKALSDNMPAAAAGLAGDWFSAAIDRADQTSNDADRRTGDAYRDLLDGRNSWHELPEVAEAAPGPTLVALWPVVTRLIERTAWPPPSRVVGYRDGPATSHGFNGEGDDPFRRPLIEAVDIALQTVARASAADALRHVATAGDSEHSLIHRMLARALVVLAPDHPGVALDYLLGDPRRFAVGSLENSHAESRALIRAVVPHLDTADRTRLEQAVRAWQYITDDTARDGGKVYERGHRLYLLTGIGNDHLSPTGRDFARAEADALPDYVQAPRPTRRSFFTGSPVSADEFLAMDDAAAAAVFDVLTDATGDDHPHIADQGGSRQASAAFGEFAGRHPERAAGILERFRHGDQERPVADALPKLAEAGWPGDAIIKLVADLDARGFASELFRSGAADALRFVAQHGNGLSDAACDLLDRWLDARWQAIELVQERSETEGSVLWGNHGIGGIGKGVIDCFLAIAAGTMGRSPPDADRWLRSLNRHRGRTEFAAAWRAFALTDIPRLALNDSSGRFVAGLLHDQPLVRDSPPGVGLLVAYWPSLPAATARDLLTAIRDGDWARGRRAYGEAITVLHCRNPHDCWAAGGVETAVNGEPGDAVRLGVATAASRLWGSLCERPTAAPLLERLAAQRDPAIAPQVAAVFRRHDRLPADATTRRLLALVAADSAVLAAADESLPTRLLDVVATYPDAACDVAEVIIRERGSDLADYHRAFARGSGALIDFAVRLQRFTTDVRPRGLRLFEDMLELGIVDAQQAIEALDRRIPNAPGRGAFPA